MTTIFSHVIAPVTNRFMRVWDENISRKEYRITRQNPNGKENFPRKQSTNGVSLLTWYLCESGVWTLWWKELSHHTFHHDTASLRWRTEHFLSVAGARARVTPGPCPHYLAQSSHRLGNSRVKHKSDCHTYCRNRPLSDTRIRLLLSNDIMTVQTIWDLLREWLWGESLGWNWLRAFLQTLADTPPLMTAESADNSSHSMAQAPVTAITLSVSAPALALLPRI